LSSSIWVLEVVSLLLRTIFKWHQVKLAANFIINSQF
jgi:hypothetical protein